MLADGAAIRATQPLISISVVSHGDGAELHRLLETLKEHELTANIQLLVTDNLGHDLPDIDNRGWHSVEMLRPPRPLGFARNHNLALQRAAGQYLCILNPDVVFQGGTFLPLIRHLERREADIVAPILRDSRGNLQDSFRDLPTPARLLRRHVSGESIPTLPSEGAVLWPDWIAGTFMLMARETFVLLGGFDPNYRLYFEDVDLCTRARLQSLKILVDPALVMLHDPRHASRRGGRHLLWHIQSALRFFASGVYRRARSGASHA